MIVVSDPSLAGPQLAAFVVPNKPVENRHLTEFQVALLTVNATSGKILEYVKKACCLNVV